MGTGRVRAAAGTEYAGQCGRGHGFVVCVCQREADSDHRRHSSLCVGPRAATGTSPSGPGSRQQPRPLTRSQQAS
jgi:hypothetical protein